MPELLKTAIKSAFLAFGYKVGRVDAPYIYNEDGLRSEHAHDFMADPDFMEAYAVARRAMNDAYHAMHWRAHVVAWCGRQASILPGDFVECGVSHGFMSSLLMTYL